MVPVLLSVEQAAALVTNTLLSLLMAISIPAISLLVESSTSWALWKLA